MKKGLALVRQLTARDREWVVAELTRSLADSTIEADVFRRTVRALPTRQRPHVFLSHSHKDKRFVRSLARKLEDYGIVVWLDEGELRVGDSLIERISSVIHETPLLLAILSRTSVKSNWVKEELHLAMTRQIKRSRVTVLPLIKEECPIPKFLAGRLYADFTTPYRRQHNFPLLLQSIVAHTKSKMVRGRG